MKLFAVLISLTLIVAVSEAERQKARLFCLRDGNIYVMRLLVYLHDDDISLMYAATSSGALDTACDSITGGSPKRIIKSSANAANTKFYYLAEVKYTGTTLDSRSDCSPTKNPAKNEYTWVFKLRTRTGATYNRILFGSDMDYTVKCDFDTATQNLFKSVSKTATGSTSSTLVKQDEVITFQVRKSSDDSAVTSISLGTNIYLHISVAPPTGSDPGATGIYTHTCKACALADCSGTAVYDLSDVDGCILANTHVGTAANPFFTEVSSNQPRTLKTGNFVNFVFNSGAQTVYFMCKIGFCYGTTTAPCSNYCLFKNPPAAPRKKRSSKDDEDTVSLKLTINMGNVHYHPIQNKKMPVEGDGSCSNNMVFISVSVVLGALLCLAVITTVVLGLRLSQSKRGNQC